MAAIQSHEGGDAADLSEKPRDDNIPATTNGDAPKDPEKQATSDSASPRPAEKKGPDGGFDATPIPSAPPGYTLKFTFHRATNLPMADLQAFSSDPYILAQLNVSTPTRHKEDPPLRFRSPTIRKNCDPVWDESWIVANVPASGFKLKVRVYDEDPADHDDRLGNVHVTVPSLQQGWAGVKDQPYEIRKRSGSKRAYAVRAFAVCFQRTRKMSGDLFLSMEMLGRTNPDDGQKGRLYTLGPCRTVRHFSPLLGRLANIKEPEQKSQTHNANGGESSGSASGSNSGDKKKVEKYNFQANQIQLPGPIPPQLYHRFVEFKPFVKRMFTGSGIQGAILGKALHHQHSRVYNFGRDTEWTHFPEGEHPGEALTKKFLELVHHDKGGRIFTYVLTLDALWRFTETGKEFGVDMLSKHTMHSDVSAYIAFSGEFFIRRLKHPRQPPPPEPTDETSTDHPPEHSENPSHPNEDLGGGAPIEESPTDPAYYQLVIDNDSGTYRPNAKLLPVLKQFFAHALPGLHIQTLDCQADEEKMTKMKGEQRERKKKEGDNIVFQQGSDSSSISSSDEEDLDRVAAGQDEEHEDGVLKAAARDGKLKLGARGDKIKNYGKARVRDGDAEGAQSAA